MIKSVIFMMLEHTINCLLRLDPNKETNLKPLVGRTVCISLTEFAFAFEMLFTHRSICIRRPVATADLIISGHLQAFIAMACRRKSPKLTSDLDIQGSIQLAHGLQDFFANTHLDWEQHLNHLLGDKLASCLNSVIRHSQKTVNHHMHQLTLDATEFLQQETTLLPSKARVELFYQSFDELRHRLARFEARINRLENLSHRS